MKLIVHPGFPKCGSTTIQNFLYAHAPKLLEEGIALPDQEFRSPSDVGYSLKPMGPALIFHYLAEGSSKFEYEQKLDQYIDSIRSNGAHQTVISAENLMNYGEGYDFALDQLLKRFKEVTFVIYVRKQDDFFLSSWVQWIYHQGIPFDSFVRERLASLYPNYDRLISRLQSRFPQSKIEVVPLVKEALAEGNLISDFMRRIGSRTKTDPESFTHSNRSLNPYICEVFSKLGCLQNEQFSNRLRVLLEKHSDDDFLFERHPEFANHETRRQILDAFEPSNRKLHAQWFPEIDFELAFRLDKPNSNKPATDLNAQLMRQDKLISFFARLNITLLSNME